MISSDVYRFLGMLLTSPIEAQSTVHTGQNFYGQVNCRAGPDRQSEHSARGRIDAGGGVQCLDRCRLVAE